MNIEQVKLIDIPSHEDSRGILSAIEQNTDVPFKIKRIFYLYNIKKNRGGHALKNTDEMLRAVSGSFSIRLSDGRKTKTFRMSNPSKGLFIPHRIYLDMYDFTDNAVCLVLANRKYDTKEYLKTTDEFLLYLKNTE